MGKLPNSGFDHSQESGDGDETMHAACVCTMLTVQIALSIGDNRHPAILMEVWAILEATEQSCSCACSCKAAIRREKQNMQKDEVES
jgi:hypothetical protein